MQYALGAPPTPNGTSNCAAGIDVSKPPAAAPAPHAAGVPGLTVRDQRDAAEARGDRRRRVLDVDLER